MRRGLASLLAVLLVAAGCSYELRELQPVLPTNSQSSIIYAADGTEILTLHAEENRTDLTLAEIPVHVRDAVIAIEDERFWTHHGVDFRGIMRAVRVNASEGDDTQGGSTITQQLVKNLLLDDEHTLSRKISEAALAWRLEERFTKERILELYLNTIYFGNGAYGIFAAAREYFGKTPDQLTPAEGATLAGMIQAPNDYDPYTEPDPVVERRNLVLDLMVDQGLLAADVRDQAVAEPLTLAPDVAPLEQRYPAAHFVEEVKQWILHDPRFGASDRERNDLLFGGGLRIHTTVDLALQAAAEAAVAQILPDAATQPEASVVSIDPRNGHVVAMVGGRDFFGGSAAAKYNLAMGKGRPTGSSFKPLVLAAALQQGLPLSTVFQAPGTMQLTYGNPPQIWDVSNYEDESPGVPVDLTEATVHSYNTVYAQLILRVGVDDAIDMAHRLGITRPLLAFPSAVLGSNDVQPLEMASAYSTFANRGVHVDPVFVTSISRADGTILYESEHHQERVLDPGVADQVTAVLSQVVQRGTGTAANLGRPTAGKTGTAQNWTDAWFCGFVPQLATAVWVGYPGDQVSMRPPTTPIRVTGGSYPARIWKAFMSQAIAGTEAEAFATTTSSTTSTTLVAPELEPNTTGVAQQVPDEVGQPVALARSDLEALGFRVSVVDYAVSGVPPGTVVAQSPPAGTTLGTGGIVTLQVAQGQGGATVPGVLGMNQRDAMDTLRRAGLEALVIQDSNPGGTTPSGVVWQQNPPGGTDAPAGSTVRIVVQP
jgi:penicillin-binding protein 1A